MPKLLLESWRSSLDNDMDSTMTVVAPDGAVFTTFDYDHDETMAVDNNQRKQIDMDNCILQFVWFERARGE
jgi:hypothetical protein